MDETKVREIVREEVKPILEEYGLTEEDIIIKVGDELTTTDTHELKTYVLKKFKIIHDIYIFLSMCGNRVKNIIAFYGKLVTALTVLGFSLNLPTAQQLTKYVLEEGREEIARTVVWDRTRPLETTPEMFVVASPPWYWYNQSQYKNEVAKVLDEPPDIEDLPDDYLYVSASGLTQSINAQVSSSADDFRT